MAEHRKLAEQFDMTTGRGRLQAASAFLRRIYAEGRPFNINTWRTDEPECGTVACAVGWMAMDEEFQAQGLTLKVMMLTLPTMLDRWRWFPSPTPGDFFGISVKDAFDLFVAGNYSRCDNPTALDVADRIDALLARDAA